MAAAFAHTFWWAIGAILIAFVPTLFLPNHAAVAAGGASDDDAERVRDGAGEDGPRDRAARHRGHDRLTARPDRLLAELTAQLSRGGCVAAEEEARELIASCRRRRAGCASPGRPAPRRRAPGLDHRPGHLRRISVVVHPGVYVPRWQSLELARRAAARLPDDGTAIDLCTGSGAIAAAWGRPAGRPHRGDGQRRASGGLRPGQRGRGPAGRPVRPAAGVVAGGDRRRRFRGPLRAVHRAAPPPPGHAGVRGRLSLRRRSGWPRAAATGRHRGAGLPAPGRGAAAGAGRRPGRPAPPRAGRGRASAPSRPGPTRTGICAAWRRRRPRSCAARLSGGRRPGPRRCDPPRASADRGPGRAPAACAEPTPRSRRGRRTARGPGSSSGSSPP